MKVVKERNTLIKYVNDLFKLSAGFERLIFFVIISVVLCHISACFWYFKSSINHDFRIILTKFEDEINRTWLVRCEYMDS